MSGEFRFSFGPWNISEGADCFGPTVRDSISFSKKLKIYQELGFGAVQLHDDDAVPNIDDLSAAEVEATARQLKTTLDEHGLIAEFVAPRLWEDSRTVDGGFTANCPDARAYALERLKKSIDIANYLGTDRIVLWLARDTHAGLARRGFHVRLPEGAALLIDAPPFPLKSGDVLGAEELASLREFIPKLLWENRDQLKQKWEERGGCHREYRW